MKTRRVAEKLDMLLWILSVPLIPMIIVELTMDLSLAVNAVFKSYYLVLWFVFTIEFAINFFIAENKTDYLKMHAFDLLVIVTPALRVFKILRVLRFPIVLLSDRALGLLGKASLNFVYYFIFITVVVLAGADIVFYFEGQDAYSDIRTFGDAIWWSVNYLTTAGSSAYIATTGGKVVGVALMTIGFAVYSILIASVVSFFIKEYAKVSPNDDLLAGIKDQLGLDEVMERLERIEKKLDGK